MSYNYCVDRISEVPTKIMEEIPSLECRNARKFSSSLARIQALLYMFVDVDVLPVYCETFIYRAMP